MVKRKYLSLARMTMQQSLAYRGMFLVNMSASIFFIVAMFYLWRAIYAGQQELAGFTWDEMKVYLLIAFVSNTLLSWYSETRISGLILDGQVAMDLLKPLDFQAARLWETLGTSVFEGSMSVIMATIVLVIYAGVMLPATAQAGILFLLSLVLSLLVKFTVVYCFSLLCFWTSSGLGIVWARAAITNLFSGALIPLPFLPDWLERIALALPFQGIVHTPASIYLGRLEGSAAFAAVGLQVGWVVVLWLAGKLIWRHAVRQVTVHGG